MGVARTFWSVLLNQFKLQSSHSQSSPDQSQIIQFSVILSPVQMPPHLPVPQHLLQHQLALQPQLMSWSKTQHRNQTHGQTFSAPITGPDSSAKPKLDETVN